jgi:putative SOS response-associated peptidase YedK
MCYSNSSTSTNVSLGKKFNRPVDHLPDTPPLHFVSGFHFPKWRIVTQEAIEIMQWGLIPRWFKDVDWKSIASKTLNARIETLAEKPSFKHLITSQRCIVPSNGFFEWQTRGKEKIPYFIAPKDEELFCMAGLFDQWTAPETGETMRSFTILTTEANELMAEIHNEKKRMPYVLKPEDCLNYLENSHLPINFSDFPLILEEEMHAHRIDKKLLLSENANQEAVKAIFVDNIGEQSILF